MHLNNISYMIETHHSKAQVYKIYHIKIKFKNIKENFINKTIYVNNIFPKLLIYKIS